MRNFNEENQSRSLKIVDIIEEMEHENYLFLVFITLKSYNEW